MRWFKVYYEARTDAKLRSLSDAQFRVWFNLLAYSAEQPVRGEIRGKPDELLAVECAGGDVPLLLDTLQRLAALQCVAFVASPLHERCVTFKNFAKRQVFSMSRDAGTSTERSRKCREQKKKGHQKRNHSCNDLATTSQRNATTSQRNATTTDTESEKEKENCSSLSPPDAGAGASAGVDDGARSALESWAREFLGDRFDLESLGPNLAAWSLAYPAVWVRQAVEAALRARPGGLAAYAHRVLARSHAAGRCVVADTLAPPPGAAPADAAAPPRPSRQQEIVNGFRRWAEEARSRPGAGEQEAADGPG